jgi:ribosomal protein S18 acetylase RimI-like enzyme
VCDRWAVTTPEIRPADVLPEEVLQRFLHLSYHDWLPPEVTRPPLEAFVASEPAVPRWCAGWGRRGDHAIAAWLDDRIVGLAWCRLLTAGDAGYSFVSPEIPCLAIAVDAAARGRGLGGLLLDALSARLPALGFGALTLAVEADNPARRLYARHGFAEEAEEGGYVRMRAVYG